MNDSGDPTHTVVAEATDGFRTPRFAEGYELVEYDGTSDNGDPDATGRDWVITVPASYDGLHAWYNSYQHINTVRSETTPGESRQSGADANHTVAQEIATSSVVADGGQQSSTAAPTIELTAETPTIAQKCAAAANQSRANATTQPSTSSATQPVVTGSQQVDPEPAVAGDLPASEPVFPGEPHGMPEYTDPEQLPGGLDKYPRKCRTEEVLTVEQIKELARIEVHVVTENTVNKKGNNLLKWFRHSLEGDQGHPTQRWVDLTNVYTIMVPSPTCIAKAEVKTIENVRIKCAMGAHYWFEDDPRREVWSWREFVAKQYMDRKLLLVDSEAVVRFECAVDPDENAKDQKLVRNCKHLIEKGFTQSVPNFVDYTTKAAVPIWDFYLYTNKQRVFRLHPNSDGKCTCVPAQDPGATGRARTRPGPTKSGGSSDGPGSFRQMLDETAHGVETTNNQGTGSSSSGGPVVAGSPATTNNQGTGISWSGRTDVAGRPVIDITHCNHGWPGMQPGDPLPVAVGAVTPPRAEWTGHSAIHSPEWSWQRNHNWHSQQRYQQGWGWWGNSWQWSHSWNAGGWGSTPW